jgi:D-alanyl-D-alanine carboxypeptidase/poly-gamma-glutamate capsule biosynthesis protein CapA/YwtB (metallophosphatase superfamily)
MSAPKKTKLIFWSIFPILIGILFSYSILYVFDKEKTFIAKDSGAKEARVIQLIAPEPTAPKYFYTNTDLTGSPKVSAKSYLVGDLNTGEVILSKDQENIFPLASVSKLMTAVVASEIMKPDETATVSRRALSTYGQNGELRLGEKIKISDLLYPLLLESSNDAAEVIAEHFGRESFISKMNAKAGSLGMNGTHYEDPSGLSPNNRSTVTDIFKLTGYIAKTHPDLLNITIKRSFSNKKHNWSNISQFLGKIGYIGGKSGYTDAARQTVVSLFSLPLAEKNDRPIAITLLQSADRKKDVESIVNYLKKNVYYGGALGAVTNWVQERIGTPDIREPDFVTLAFGGDIMLDRGVRNSVVKNFGNDYSALFSKLDIFKNSDIAFANLEGPVSDVGTDMRNLYSFRMDPSAVPALKGAGITILSVANNHVGDWGRPAYIDTLARLKENEILYTGGGNTRTEAETPAVIEKYGMKIGFLAFSDVGPNWMGVQNDNAGLLLASDPRFDEIIKNASKQVDYLVVSMHFGDEYKTVHNARQEYLAHKAVDDGAKIVVGAHPHVPEDFEVYSRKGCAQSSCMSYIAYSLGNFVFDQSWSKDTMKGMLLEIKLGKDGSLSVRKDPTQLNSVFQLEKITQGKEEKIKFPEAKPVL